MSRIVVFSALLLLLTGSVASGQAPSGAAVMSAGPLAAPTRLRVPAPELRSPPTPEARVGSSASGGWIAGVAAWLGRTVPRQRAVLAYEVRRAATRAPLPGPRAWTLAVGAALLALLPAFLLLRTRGRRTPAEAPAPEAPRLPRTEQARRLLAGGVREVDAAREAHMAQDGLEILLRLSDPAAGDPSRVRRPWGADTAGSPSPVPVRATYRRPR